MTTKSTPVSSADERTTQEKLDSVRVSLHEWRQLRWNASQMLNGRSFGRCDREVVRLEGIESALLARLAAEARS